MTQDIRIPDIGDADDVEVVEILAAVGDEVGEDDPIIVIESDKASMEVPSGFAGTIHSIDVAVGDKVTEGQVIARLDGAGAQQNGKPDSAAEAQGEPDQAESEPPEADGEEPQAEEAAPEPAGKTSTLEIKVPDIGEAQDVEVIEVAVKAGDTVSVDDLLVVVESDKASMEIPSTHAGTVKAVHVSEGSQVEEGTLLVTLETSGAAATPKAAEKPAPEKSAPAPAAKQPAAEGKAPAASGASETAAKEAPSPDVPSSGASVYAGPAVRRLARELGVDLAAVEGSGNRGRIVKDDVKAHVKKRLAGGAAAPASGLPAMPRVDFSKFGEVEEQPLSRIRARGAENLHRSWLNVPHVTQHDDVDVTDLEAFRVSLKSEGERKGIKITPVAFIIKACCQALKEFPTFNASLDPQATTFILKHYYNVGMAVDTPDGLVVPVIRDADKKGVWELSAEVAELADKARNKKLGVSDLQGGSFSVSSLGAIGGTGFTPIINAPEVAILGVGRLTVKPFWTGEAFEPRKMLPLSLSYDHRAINGAEAGRFVARLSELLGDIRRLAL